MEDSERSFSSIQDIIQNIPRIGWVNFHHMGVNAKTFKIKITSVFLPLKTKCS